MYDLHNLEWLRSVCDEPFLNATRSELELFFSTDEVTPEALRALWDVFNPGSRRGLVHFFAVAHRAWARDLICDMRFASAAARLWTEGKHSTAFIEFPWLAEELDPQEVVWALCRHARSAVIMTPGDLAALGALPDRLTVYRGGHRDRVREGHSWTTDATVAAWFAESVGGIVVSRRIRKSQVIACFTDRQEGEVVLLPARRRRP
jgi:hypothetical protein